MTHQHTEARNHFH